MSRVGVIGLGVMGRAMAANLLRAGHEVTVHSRSPAPVDAAVALGAARGDGPAHLGSSCEVVITALPDSAAVEQVVLGEDGVFSSPAQRLLYIDTSTVSPGTARLVAARAEALGVGALDAPVSGGERGAVDATLAVMVGGAADDVAAARPVLEALGSTIVHVGPAGAGQTVKAANQMLVAGTITLVAEAIVLLERCGVDPATAVGVLAGGLAGNRILDTRTDDMIARRFAPGARVALHRKDLGIALETARAVGVFTPLTAVTEQLFSALRALGRDGLDHTAVLTLIDDLSGDGKDTKHA
jgi:2-hydroxy-3-oxopropionate reductase